MEIVKIRRVGNSNVLSVPRSLARAGYEAGQPVLIEQLDNGDLLIRRVESHRQFIRETMRSVAKKHRRSLDMLAAHDRGEETGASPNRVPGNVASSR